MFCSYTPSPFQIAVQPASFDLAQCTAAGSGLSLATAGASASITVTLRDRFGNYQPSVAAGSITLTLNNGTVALAVTDCSGGLCPSVKAGPFITSPPFVPSPAAAPLYVLAYTATVSGPYWLSVLGTKTFAATNAKLANSVAGSPFRLIVQPSLPCASLSSFSVSATAARPAEALSVVLTSRDAYGNPQSTMPLAVGRSSAGSVVDTVAMNWLSTTSVFSPSVRNRYEAVLLAPTTAGSNTVLGYLGLAGSLFATYYSGVSSAVTAFPSSIDFSVASGGTFQTFSATFSARYSGVIAVAQTGVQTFKIRNVGTADRFSLTVSNKVLIDMLSAAPAANADTTATMSLPQSCALFDVSLQYVCTSASAGRGITLSLIADGVYVVPQLQMWYAPHLVMAIPLAVGGAPICASKCTVIGYAATASILTAGISTSFTIQAVDSWGNLLKNTDNVFSFAIVPYFIQDTSTRGTMSLHPPASTTSSQLNVNDASHDDTAAGVAASVTALGSGKYVVSYSTTRSGWYYIRGKLTQAGGLYGVYMESALLVEGGASLNAQPPAQRIDSVVDFDWGSKSPLDGWASGT